MAADYNLVPTDQLFAKIEDQLNSYATNGLLDTGRFFSEVKLIINKLGIEYRWEIYEMLKRGMTDHDIIFLIENKMK